MKKEHRSKEKKAKQNEIKRVVEQRMQRWERMLKGDSRALIEIMIERGMAKKEDFDE